MTYTFKSARAEQSELLRSTSSWNALKNPKRSFVNVRILPSPTDKNNTDGKNSSPFCADSSLHPTTTLVRLRGGLQLGALTGSSPPRQRATTAVASSTSPPRTFHAFVILCFGVGARSGQSSVRSASECGDDLGQSSVRSHCISPHHYKHTSPRCRQGGLRPSPPWATPLQRRVAVGRVTSAGGTTPTARAEAATMHEFTYLTPIAWVKSACLCTKLQYNVQTRTSSLPSGGTSLNPSMADSTRGSRSPLAGSPLPPPFAPAPLCERSFEKRCCDSRRPAAPPAPPFVCGLQNEYAIQIYGILILNYVQMPCRHKNTGGVQSNTIIWGACPH